MDIPATSDNIPGTVVLRSADGGSDGSSYYAIGGQRSASKHTVIDAGVVLDTSAKLYFQTEGYFRNLISVDRGEGGIRIIQIGQGATSFITGIQIMPGSSGYVAIHSGSDQGSETLRIARDNVLIGMTSPTADSDKTLHIANGTAPSANPSGGGVLYVEAGALKYKGSSGTVTTLASA